MHLLTGYYWIDPNEGSPMDAMRVLCNFTNELSTCVFPSRKVRIVSLVFIRNNGQVSKDLLFVLQLISCRRTVLVYNCMHCNLIHFSKYLTNRQQVRILYIVRNTLRKKRLVQSVTVCLGLPQIVCFIQDMLFWNGICTTCQPAVVSEYSLYVLVCTLRLVIHFCKNSSENCKARVSFFPIVVHHAFSKTVKPVKMHDLQWAMLECSLVIDRYSEWQHNHFPRSFLLTKLFLAHS